MWASIGGGGAEAVEDVEADEDVEAVEDGELWRIGASS
jgi:hypothetical protein